MICSQDIYDKLKKSLNLPDNCREITMKLKVGELVSIRCEFFPIDTDLVLPVFEDYELKLKA